MCQSRQFHQEQLGFYLGIKVFHRAVGTSLDPLPHMLYLEHCIIFYKLEDLKVLRRSPDLFNNVKIGQGFRAYNKTCFVLPYMGVAAILVK